LDFRLGKAKQKVRVNHLVMGSRKETQMAREMLTGWDLRLEKNRRIRQ
jgi:hypothetical protein